MSPFDKSFERLFINEGGWTNDPKDRGNWTSGKINVGECKGTKFGISAMSYPNLDIQHMTADDAKAIYYNDFWKKLQLDYFPDSFTFQLFDSAVNHGIPRTVKLLQYAVKTTADGIIGPNTINAVNSVDPKDLVLLFLANRLTYMTGLDAWEHYGAGWANRIAHNLQYAAEDN